MIRKRVPLLFAALFALAPGAATAQKTFQPVQISFVEPTGIDPNFFDFTQNGQAYDIPGDVFLPTSMGGLGGADFRVPHSVSGIAFNGFDFTFHFLDFAGMAEIIPSVNPPFDASPYAFTPWLAPDGTVGDGGTAGADADIGSALVGQDDPFASGHRFFADVVVKDLGDVPVDVFRASTIHVVGDAVPETGAFALAVGLLLGGGAPFAIRIRRTCRSASRP